MIELDWTVIVQILNFLILLGIMNRFLFRPLRRVLDERHTLVESSRKQSVEGRAELERLRTEIEERLAAARREVYAHRHTMREQATAEAAALIDQARKRSESLVARAREQLTAEVESAKPEISRIAADIALQIRQRLFVQLAS
ncbi:MAG: ATP synthase F0 subunit B [Candidatus Schekmanbacteria bacterium]|nr:ATP synthase F0 subunit B [Candidatus Schekmanbacteria bacterium]